MNNRKFSVVFIWVLGCWALIFFKVYFCIFGVVRVLFLYLEKMLLSNKEIENLILSCLVMKYFLNFLCCFVLGKEEKFFILIFIRCVVV